MKKIFHFYSLTPEWLHKLAEQIETNVIEDKIINFPKKIGFGSLYFSQITSSISIVFMDVILNTPLEICREPSENELYIFHYDLSEHVNLIKINNENYEIGSFDKLDLAIIDNQIASSFKPNVHERTFALRILVDKSLLNDFITQYSVKLHENKAYEQSNSSFYHYGHIDSNSTLLLKSLKSKPINDLSFDSFVKGISLKLLGNFFSKFYDAEHKTDIVTHTEDEAIHKTEKYLLDNLSGPFPSLTFLAAMAGMSESKYKTLFKKCMNITPNYFFITEKMKYAQKLLRSGNYNSLTDMLYEFNYSKLSYFSLQYYKHFNRKPSEDFVKNIK
ncbi:helix-turn-helix domain-containing protein [Flavobacterium sp. FlaQc-28]|uniref:helix-turn-helix domain-containing protein n=1 Tax=Flavobacterium sp. FlaQc-28 TaxID=3374178 RepID=UPI0037567F18